MTLSHWTSATLAEGYLTTLEAVPLRGSLFGSRCIAIPCRWSCIATVLLLRGEGLLCAAPWLVLPLKKVALASIPVLGAPEKYPVQFHCPSDSPQ